MYTILATLSPFAAEFVVTEAVVVTVKVTVPDVDAAEQVLGLALVLVTVLEHETVYHPHFASGRSMSEVLASP